MNGGLQVGRTRWTHYQTGYHLVWIPKYRRKILTREVAEAVMRGLSAEGVLVVCRAHQFCMALREGGTHDTLTTTSEALGALAEPAQAAQAWALLGGAGKEEI